MKKPPPKSLEYFCENLIDYAGLFPPAKLSLNEAFDNYIKYKNGHFKWMLSQFVCPVKMLKELITLIRNNYPGEKDIYISAIPEGGNTTEEFIKNFNNDLISCSDFISHCGDSAEINTFEIKLPEEIINEHHPKKISELINSVSSGINEKISEQAFVFFEGITGTDWKKNISSLINAIEIHNESISNCGFKLRTGGIAADSFPSPKQISFSIRECLDREVRMKFTAGLHHPFIHNDIEIGTTMYGFINVFAAGIIAMRHNISNHGMEKILTDESPGNFIFKDDTFSWKDWNISTGEINFARKNLVVSFGSCSFDEPVDDLKLLRLL
jgi:hypothetical protein